LQSADARPSSLDLLWKASPQVSINTVSPPSQIIFVVGRINESRRVAEWNEFLPNLPGNSGFTDLVDRDTLGKRPGHSHSIVAGGLPEMSYTTREMPGTSLITRCETRSRNSYGKRAQRAVMKSMVSTARSAITWS
jgi:hypothetical protein